MVTTSSKIECLRKSHVKELVALAKSLGFKARFMPYMNYGCAQPGLGNFVIDWSSFNGNLPEKLVAQKKMSDAMHQARLAFFEREK